MQLYKAVLQCREPVANGFTCDTEDQLMFSHSGEPLTMKGLREAGSEELSNKRCWKCFAGNWRIQDVFPITYKASDTAVRV